MAMTHWMRRVAPYLLAAVLLAFVVSLAYFGTQRGSGGAGGGGAAVVTVDGDAVSAVTFDRAYRSAVEQTRQMAGDRWTEELPRLLRLREQVVERLIEERLIARGAAQEGIVVSDAELATRSCASAPSRRAGASPANGTCGSSRWRNPRWCPPTSRPTSGP